MNTVDVVSLITIFVLRLSKTGRTVGKTGRMDGRSDGQTSDWVRRKDRIYEIFNLRCLYRSLNTMIGIERLVLKNPIHATSQRVKRT